MTNFEADFMSVMSEVETQTLGNHLLASQSLQEEITPVYDNQAEKASPQGYDVYHDSNLSEVINCVPILQRLMVRVRELQEEWPDHPILIQVTQIVLLYCFDTVHLLYR
ncbi:uncharacterized protein LOC133180624 [Saccostrea echinata]|uniref:uncharacterized protein LOC133180624 n=1 Tax=Saccostrea echinata TaxID=191078 RepID=UPI002A81E5F4|nr:uncharacterized protein LOC133180624 [Saccostrea echinata]